MLAQRSDMENRGRFKKGDMPWNTGMKGWTKDTGAGFQKGHGNLGGGVEKGTRLSPETEFKKGVVPWNKGLIGVMPKPWNKGSKGLQQAWNKGKVYSAIRGDKHHNWKGGTSAERARLKSRIEYKEWRTAVFERDNYTCQMCTTRGGRLEADHIKPWSRFPELRYEISNGRTLCVLCHRKTDTWGRKATLKGIEEAQA